MCIDPRILGWLGCALALALLARFARSSITRCNSCQVRFAPPFGVMTGITSAQFDEALSHLADIVLRLEDITAALERSGPAHFDRPSLYRGPLGPVVLDDWM